MGQIINLDTWEGELPDALTETGRGGFLSSGYLGERPACAAIEDDETVQFVVTNRKRGVTIAADDTRHVTPASGYRTVVVVTDRRVVALVGTGSGDEQFTLDMGDIVDVETTSGRRTGRLSIDHADGTTWHVHTETNGLDTVAAYLDDASEAWRRVEGLLTALQRNLRTADDQRQTGEYEAALATVQSSRDRFEAALSAAESFGAQHPGTALEDRVGEAESDCRTTVAAIHIDRARAAAAEGRRHTSAGAYDEAQTAYERAASAYDHALDVDHGELVDTERIEDERDRVAELVTALAESPLRKAITADRAAVGAAEPSDAADHWERALAHYREALATDGTAARFSGDDDRIRDRMDEVAERLTAIQRSAASDAMRAGDWYSDANQFEAALESFEEAADAIDQALSTAHEWYPEAVTHLRAEQEAVQQRVDRTEARLQGDPVDDHIETHDEPQYEVATSLGDIDEPTDIEASIDPPTPPADDADRPVSTAGRIRDLDAASATDVVTEALAETDWRVRAAPARSPFDLLAERDAELMGVVVHTGDDGVGRDRIKYCEVITGAGGTDSVMLATTALVDQRSEQVAADLGVRLLGVESVAAIVDGGDITVPAGPGTGPGDEDLIPRK